MAARVRQEGSLFTDQTRGGVIGGLGYNFQDAYIITTLPSWLSNPTFHSFLKEGFEDVDVRFEDGTGTWTWHYQLKNHKVTVAEFRQVLGRFQEVAQRTDLNPTRFILACAGLAQPLASLWNLVQELRGANKVYSDRQLGPSRNDLQSRLDKLDLGEFTDVIINLVEIDYEIPALRDTDPNALMERFRARFVTLPIYHREDYRVVDRLFSQLAIRINKAVRKGLTREEIVRLVERELASATKGPATVVYLHGWIRQQYELPPDHEIDWSDHFDHETLHVPSPDVWAGVLLPELEALRARLDENGEKRCIWLRARAPLSAALAFGRTFAEAAGYSITVQQPCPGVSGGIEYWRTDSDAGGADCLQVIEAEGQPDSDEVAVGIGITDDARMQVEQYIGSTGLKVRAAMYLHPLGGPSPISVNKGNVGGMAAFIKQHIRRFSNQHRARLVHLFYVGPLALAVLLGQKLNGLPDIQCYERDKTAGYVRSCRLPG